MDRLAAPLDAYGVRPGQVTAAGLVVGIGACVAAGLGAWWVALGLWLANRTLDGLDGSLARRHGATDFGGFLDFTADFVDRAGAFAAAIGGRDPCCRVR